MNDTQEAVPHAEVQSKKKMTVIEIVAVFFFSNVLLALVVLTILLVEYISPPANSVFPVKISYTDEMGIRTLGDELEKSGVIRSSYIFQGYVRVTGMDRSLKTGVYHFTAPESLKRIAIRFRAHETGSTDLRITIPEGYTREQMAKLFAAKFANFDSAEFLDLTQALEGYLFPDTYLFDADASAEDVIAKMTQNFEFRTKDLFAWKTEEEISNIVTMASILEEEGKALEDKRIIAGILEKRIKIGMRLQVDATFLYINGKTTYELTTADLQVDSPYNTYKYAGLPPGPISSPGLISIQAAMNPDDRGYLYYLTDTKGNFYYANTHDEHVANKRKYMHL